MPVHRAASPAAGMDREARTRTSWAEARRSQQVGWKPRGANKLGGSQEEPSEGERGNLISIRRWIKYMRIPEIAERRIETGRADRKPCSQPPSGFGGHSAAAGLAARCTGIDSITQRERGPLRWLRACGAPPNQRPRFIPDLFVVIFWMTQGSWTPVAGVI
eukprot:gene12746-biopygen48